MFAVSVPVGFGVPEMTAVPLGFEALEVVAVGVVAASQVSADLGPELQPELELVLLVLLVLATQREEAKAELQSKYRATTQSTVGSADCNDEDFRFHRMWCSKGENCEQNLERHCYLDKVAVHSVLDLASLKASELLGHHPVYMEVEPVQAQAVACDRSGDWIPDLNPWFRRGDLRAGE